MAVPGLYISWIFAWERSHLVHCTVLTPKLKILKLILFKYFFRLRMVGLSYCSNISAKEKHNNQKKLIKKIFISTNLNLKNLILLLKAIILTLVLFDCNIW